MNPVRFHRLAPLSAPLSFALLLACAPVHADVVISQVYGGGGNSGAVYKNDFIELFNNGSSPVDLSGWSVQYASSTGTSWQRTNLSGSIAPGAYYLVQQAQGTAGSLNLPAADMTGTIAMSGTAGKIALVRNATTLSGSCPTATAAVADFVGFGSATNCSLGAPTATLSNVNSAQRKDNGCANTSNNSQDFAIAAAAPRNSASAANFCGGSAQPTNPTLSASAAPASLISGETTLLTATVVAGANPTSSDLLVIADLSNLGGLPGQPMYDDGSHGDQVANDLVFSLQATIGAGVSGNRSIAFSARDAQGRSASASTSVSVVSLVSIAQIQGDGARSPLVGQTVATEGVVTGRRRAGFYIQSADGAGDGNPATSEGVYVYTGSAPNASVVALGNRVRVQGKVTEYAAGSNVLPITELTSPIVSLLASGEALPQPQPLSTDLLNPQSPVDALEHLEGMRVRAELEVVAPSDGYINESSATSGARSEFYAVLPGTPRPFREPGLGPDETLPAPTNTPRFDGNWERLRVDSDELGGALLTVDAGARIAEFNAILEFDYNAWSLLPDASPALAVTAGPAPRPAISAGEHEFTVSGFNLLRFFDDVNDPAVGEPVLTSAAYAFRLAKTANAICSYLNAPDVVGVVEVESLPVLSRLADEINATCPAAPQYVAYLEEGNDVGGIDIGFLVSQREVAAGLPRVEVASIEQIGKDTLWTQPDGTPSLLNDRPSLALKVTVNGANGAGYPVTVIANHLRSLNGANEDSAAGDRVRRKRAAQAVHLAEWIEARQQANPDEAMILVGDFNAFEFNDGLVDSMGIITGDAAPADQVVMHAASPVSRPLQVLSAEVEDSERYSYTYGGSAQSLDHLLGNQALLAQVEVLVDHARLNADFSKARFGDAANDAYVSDHDPVLAVVEVPAFRSADLHVAVAGPHTPIISGRGAEFRVRAGNLGPDAAPRSVLSLRANAPASALTVNAAAGWQCAVVDSRADSSQIDCRYNGELGNGAAADFVVRANPPRNFPRTQFVLEASIAAASTDTVEANNGASASQRVTGVPGF